MRIVLYKIEISRRSVRQSLKPFLHNLRNEFTSVSLSRSYTQVLSSVPVGIQVQVHLALTLIAALVESSTSKKNKKKKTTNKKHSQ